MKKLRIENCELRMRESRDSPVDSQFSILNSQFLTALLFLWATTGMAATPTPLPTTTPTPRPRLSGGFGRPAATPAAPESPSRSSQSLSEVVRAAEDGKTRKDQKSSVAITNDSLVTDTSKGRLTTSAPRNAAPPAPARTAEAPASAARTPTPSANAEEAEWRERARSARARVEELKQRISQFESEAKKLENDFYSWDDGSYRDGVIKPAWDRKKEELETARKDLVQAQADLAELPEKARKAGALPGWLRE
jgi:hypothetical protein